MDLDQAINVFLNNGWTINPAYKYSTVFNKVVKGHLRSRMYAAKEDLILEAELMIKFPEQYKDL